MKFNKKIILLLFLIVFIYMNIILCSNVLATNSSTTPSTSGTTSTSTQSIVNTVNGASVGKVHPVIATVLRGLLAVAQVGFTGYFVIRFTWEGIIYMSAVTVASEKAKARNQMKWALIFGVLSMVIPTLIFKIYDKIL